MDNDKFIELCKKKVVDYTNTFMNLNSIDRPVHISTGDVYVVWLNRTLQNNKALLSTTVSNGMLHTMEIRTNFTLMLIVMYIIEHLS